MAAGGRRLLDALAGAVDGLGLVREPVRECGELRWWRRRWQEPAAPDGTNAWTWCTIPLDVPAGTVSLGFGVAGEVLQWHRGRKGWASAWSFQSGVIEPAAGYCAWAGERHREWWHGDPWVHEVGAPPGMHRPSAGALTTGRVIVMFEHGGGSRAQALLLLAKADTRFRRLGLWGLRDELAARLAAPWRDVLVRGRGGELHSPG